MKINDVMFFVEGVVGGQLHAICKTCKTIQLIGDRCTVCFEWVNAP